MIASAQTSNSKLAQINNKLTVQSQNFAADSYAISLWIGIAVDLISNLV